MRSLYRRTIKLVLVDEAQKEEAQGWATTLDAEGHEVLHYFKGDQGRYMQHIRQDGVASLRLQLEKMGIHPKSITIKRAFNTFTFTNLSFRRDRAAKMNCLNESRHAA